MGKHKATKPMSGGVEGMLDIIAQNIHARAARQGLVWCEHRTHPFRKAGKACKVCVHQTVLWEAFVRSMGDRVVRGEWIVQ